MVVGVVKSTARVLFIVHALLDDALDIVGDALATDLDVGAALQVVKTMSV